MTHDLGVRLLDRDDPATVADRARRLAPVLKALADPHRLRLVLLLADRPRTVRELGEDAGLGQTLVSHHLAPLREQRLVTVTPRPPPAPGPCEAGLSLIHI